MPREFDITVTMTIKARNQWEALKLSAYAIEGSGLEDTSIRTVKDARLAGPAEARA